MVPTKPLPEAAARFTQPPFHEVGAERPWRLEGSDALEPKAPWKDMPSRRLVAPPATFGVERPGAWAMAAKREPSLKLRPGHALVARNDHWYFAGYGVG